MSTAEIIAIGSELLTPTRLDTNSLWLTEKLNEIGVEVVQKTVVGDEPNHLESAMRAALQRSPIVITTGGLGPTEDDRTRQCAAAAVGQPLVFHKQLLENIEQRFRQMGYEMPAKNRSQAYVIEGCRVIDNPNGTAVGMILVRDRQLLIILPGPPRELQPMFVESVQPLLEEHAGAMAVRRKTLRVSGMGESALDELIAPIYTLVDNPQTSILFNKTEIEIQLTAKATSSAEADRLNEQLSSQLVEKLGIAVFSVHGETMEEVVAELLTQRNQNLSVAESCTGGLLAQRLTEVPGSSAYFIEGIVSYHNDAKMQLLGVPRELLDRVGAVSAEVAEVMAAAVREKAGTDYSLSVTGIAGPGGGTSDKPVGTVFIGYSDSTQTKSLRLRLLGDRSLIRWRSSQMALDYLRRQILKQDTAQAAGC
jgi:nicotinamide-nucleotide amidase